MNNRINRKNPCSSGSIIIKTAYVILALICAVLLYVLIEIYHNNHSFGWSDLTLVLVFVIPIFFNLRRKKPAGQPEEEKLEWKTLSLAGKIYWATIIAIFVGAILFAIFGGIVLPLLSRQG
jgi:uncharacterized protein (DUF2062 family)